MLLDIEFLTIIILVALFSAFTLCFLQKIGVIEKMQLRGLKIIAELAHCQFCLSFWTCTSITLLLMLVLGFLTYPLLFFTPLFATPITRFLIR